MALSIVSIFFFFWEHLLTQTRRLQQLLKSIPMIFLDEYGANLQREAKASWPLKYGVPPPFTKTDFFKERTTQAHSSRGAHGIAFFLKCKLLRHTACLVSFLLLRFS